MWRDLTALHACRSMGSKACVVVGAGPVRDVILRNSIQFESFTRL
jgi:hypothetical protein